MKQRRINSIIGIKRTSKRTRITRSFRDESNQTTLQIKNTTQSKHHSSDGVKRRVHKKPIIENNFKASEARKSSPKKRKKNIFSIILKGMKQHWFWLQYVVKIGVIIIGIVLFFNNREKTVLTLRPHHEYLEINEAVSVYKNPKEHQLGFDVMSINDQVSIPIIAKGVRDIQTKASGMITVYNNYSTEPQRLLSETRFKSASGKIFYLGENPVIVPGKTNTEPGIIDVQVYASEPGPNYNIDITDFTIPGFKEAGLSDKYSGMYAVSRSRFTGGNIGTESYVTESQRTTAELELIKLLNTRLQERLIAEANEDILIIEKTPTITMLESEYLVDKEQGIEVLSKNGSIFTLVVGKERFKEYIENSLNSVEIEYPFVVTNMGNVEVKVEPSSIDFEKINSIVTQIEGSPLIKFQLDENEIKEKVQGKLLNSIPNIFKDVPEVDRIHVITKPFWKKKISSHLENIYIKYE